MSVQKYPDIHIYFRSVTDVLWSRPTSKSGFPAGVVTGTCVHTTSWPSTLDPVTSLVMRFNTYVCVFTICLLIQMLCGLDLKQPDSFYVCSLMFVYVCMIVFPSIFRFLSRTCFKRREMLLRQRDYVLYKLHIYYCCCCCFYNLVKSV